MAMISTRIRWMVLFGCAALVALVQVTIAGDPSPGPTKTVAKSPVYEDGPERIRFAHDRHADVACSTCHGAASTSQRAADVLSPSMEVCASCHAGEKAATPALEDCGGCHAGHDVQAKQAIEKPADWKAFRPAPMPAPRGKASIRFDHAKHVRAAVSAADPQGCASCHGPDTAGEPSMPSMASCQSCHNGAPAAPPSDCATCHPTDGKVLDTNLAAGPLKPTNHDANWEKRHGTVAAASPDDCASCHLVEEDCASCHVEEVAKPFAVHPPNYLAIHSVDARGNQGTCTDCHRPETFCTSCHTDARAVTRDAGRPPDRLQYHPDGWLDSSLPNNHGVMARRNLSECASCHVENDCVTCHAGINPHPANFALECRQMSQANASMCRRCHETLPPCL